MDTNAKMGDAMMDVVMGQAMRDKMAEYEAHQKAANKAQVGYAREDQEEKDEDDDDLMDEDAREIMQKMKDDRLRDVKNQQALEEIAREKKANVWYGEYTEILENEFLPYVTKAEYSAVHFFHKDFERCKIIDKHLQIIAPQHKECKFLKLDAEKAPFFIQKLAIQVLPTICLFKDGVLVDRIVGFEELGGKDDFNTIMLTRRLVKGGVLKAKTAEEKGTKISKGRNRDESDSDDDF